MSEETVYQYRGDKLAVTLRKRLERFARLRHKWEERWTKAWRRSQNQYEKELGDTEGEGWRSKLFYGMTRQKIRVAVSIVSDIVLQQGRLPYDLTTTPVSDSEDSRVSEELKIDPVERVEGMKRLIDDQFIESKINDELYTTVLSAAQLGTGIIKGPYVVYRTKNRWVPKLNEQVQIPAILPEDDQEIPEEEVQESLEKAKEVVKQNVHYELIQEEIPVPSIKAIDIWDIFCDPESEDVQKGQGVFERALLTKEGLAELSLERDEEGNLKYDVQAIADLLNAGESKQRGRGDAYDSYRDFEGERGPHREKYQETDTSSFYSVFTYAGAITRKEFIEYVERDEKENGPPKIDPKSIESHLPVEVIVTFCRNRILSVVENPHPKKIRPYHVSPWSRIPGSPYGWGISCELEHSQSAMNGFLRLFIDNKRLAGSLGFVIDESRVENPDENIRPGFRYRVTAGHSVRDVILPIVFPDIGGNILEAMQWCERWGNTDSGIPAFLTGDDIQHRAHTAYEANELKSSALKQLGMPIRYLDERIIVRIVEAFHYWNMANHPDESVKGDFEVHAKGFSSFTDKMIRANELRQLLAMSAEDPEVAGEVNKGEIIKELVRIGELPEEKFLKTEEEKEQIATQRFEDTQREKQELLEQSIQSKQMDHDHEARMLGIKLEFDGQQKALDREAKVQELQDRLLDSAMKIEAMKEKGAFSAKAS